MELADLVHALVDTGRRFPRIRRVLGFFALGGLGLALGSWLPTPRPTLVVQVDPDAPDAARTQAIEQAALMRVGLDAGWPRTDPVIRDRLLRNLRFAGVEGEDDALLRVGEQLGMSEVDPVIRARILSRAADTLSVGPPPPRATLQAYLEAHADRFSTPGRAAFDHVFLDHTAGEDQASDITAALVAGAKDWRELGRPHLSVGAQVDRAVDKLQRTLGATTTEAIQSAPLGIWSGPIPGPHGLHWVRPTARTVAQLPELNDVYAAVLAHWRADHRAQDRAQAMAALIAGYDVELRP